MDIARVRKKLKQLKDNIEKKAEEVPKKEEIKDSQEVKDVKTEAGVTPDVSTDIKVEESGLTTHKAITDETQIKDIEIITFKVANEEYAVRLSEMQEIIRYQKIYPVPRAPKYLKGVTFLRGKILPVIDLQDRLGIKGDRDKKQKIVVLYTSKEPVGMLVGSLLNVLRFSETEFLQPPATLSDREKSFIMGVVRVEDRFISILNVDEVVNMEVI